MLGSRTISPATGVPLGKEKHHGTQTSPRPHYAGRDLAYRQAHPRAESLPKHWHRSTRRSRTTPRESDGTDATGFSLRHQAFSNHRAGRGEVCAREQHKRTIDDDVSRLKGLLPWIGSQPLDRIHRGILQPWINSRRRARAAVGTINHGLQIVRRITNLAAGKWVDEQGLTWLQTAPKIKLLANSDKRKPYLLSWMEQNTLFCLLPAHLADMAIFAVNTGCRDAEICNLLWGWEVAVRELQTSIFIIPGARVKNGEERLVALKVSHRGSSRYPP